MLKKLMTICLVMLTSLLFSQTGKITGKIIDSKTGETLPGATVLVEGTTKGASADFDGLFSINNIPVGKVNLVISYVSYDTKKLTDVVVLATDVTNVNIGLNTATSQELTEVIVQATVNKENTVALIMQQKNNASVSDGVSAESIKRTPDKNTSDVLKRVSGATVQDDKFVIVRGLNDRYNTSYLNGAPLPSTESDRKAFSFDVFPSSMLDNLVIYKTARPDLPGEFAGGIIDITTKGIPEKNFIQVSAGGAYNSITTGKDQMYGDKGKKDWLGVDDGTRSLSNDIPEQRDFSQDIHEQGKYAKQYNTGSWGTKTTTFKPNSSYLVSAGYNIKLKDRDFIGIIGSVSYNNTNNFFTTTRNSHEVSTVSDEKMISLNDTYTDKTYQNQKLIGTLLNLTCKVTTNHAISSKNLYSINTDDRTIERAGLVELAKQDGNPTMVKSTAFWYTQNNILSNQLIGDHYFPKLKLKLNWNGGFTEVKRKIPNLKRSYYTRQSKLIPIIPEDPSEPVIIHPTDTVFQAQIPNSGTSGPDYSGVFLSSNLVETMRSFKMDISRNFKITSDLSIEGKVGALYQLRDRDYKMRQFSYSKYGTAGQTVSFLDSIKYLAPEQLYSQQNMGLISPGTGGLKLTEDTKFNQNLYKASSSLMATYAMIDVKYKSFVRLVTGVRNESYHQTLSTPHALYYFNNEWVKKDTIVNDFLPSANLIFSLTEKQNIRLSYSKTLNRPEFREIAPLAFYDFNTGYTLSGDPTLQRATIKNYDVRYEIYPGASQLASVSVFYKDFTNPIELVQGGNANEITYRNAPKAYCQGIELDYRINLGILSSRDSSFMGRLLNNLTVFSNFSYIKSRTTIVGVSASQAGVKLGERQMQGQSPYIVNAGLTYNDPKYNYSLSASFNRFGPRIYVVGNISDVNKDGIGNLWEMGRNVLDLQATKSFFKNRFEIRFNVKDVFAKKQLQLFNIDFENNVTYNKNTVAEKWVKQYGTTYSLQLSFKF